MKQLEEKSLRKSFKKHFDWMQPQDFDLLISDAEQILKQTLEEMEKKARIDELEIMIDDLYARKGDLFSKNILLGNFKNRISQLKGEK